VEDKWLASGSLFYLFDSGFAKARRTVVEPSLDAAPTSDVAV
jgi:hypothetical protein